jgi:hypothetical protein
LALFIRVDYTQVPSKYVWSRGVGEVRGREHPVNNRQVLHQTIVPDRRRGPRRRTGSRNDIATKKENYSEEDKVDFRLI